MSSTGQRAEQLFEEHKQSIARRTDRMFVWLMPLQWLAGIGFALWVSPRTWSGDYSAVHPHVWAALFLGGAITFWPVFCAIKWPGLQTTRYMIAIAQSLMSALLIHLSGGRIETHFHIFGSLAFLACYRDWRVLVAASAVVALDHFIRGVYFPLSVFGVLTASPYLWMEHAAWVVFEDVFLIISIRQSVKEMLGIAERQAALEAVNLRIEQTVAERTAELTEEIAERKHAEAEMERMHIRLMDASRKAGMAEVATNVIHNVGNVLNSVNISQSVLSEKVRKSKIGSLVKTANLIEEKADNLAAYLTTDPAGQKVPKFLAKLAQRLSHEQEEMPDGTRPARPEHRAHQGDHLRAAELRPRRRRPRNAPDHHPCRERAADRRHDIGPPSHRDHPRVWRGATGVPRETQGHADIGQSRQQCETRVGRQRNRRQTAHRAHFVRRRASSVKVSDNGAGIAEENLTRIFVHGFTTKKDGHGFGLHSGVLAAREMGGSLTVQSAGAGRGATFTLKLPLTQNGDTRNHPSVPDKIGL